MKTEVEVALHADSTLLKESNRAVAEGPMNTSVALRSRTAPGEEVRVIAAGAGNGDLCLGLNNQPTSDSHMHASRPQRTPRKSAAA